MTDPEAIKTIREAFIFLYYQATPMDKEYVNAGKEAIDHLADADKKVLEDARELTDRIQGMYHQGVYADETAKLTALITADREQVKAEERKACADRYCISECGGVDDVCNCADRRTIMEVK